MHQDHRYRENLKYRHSYHLDRHPNPLKNCPVLKFVLQKLIPCYFFVQD